MNASSNQSINQRNNGLIVDMDIWMDGWIGSINE